MMHVDSSEAMRGILEPVIFTKSITYKRDVKRGVIKLDPSTDALLAAYKARLQPSTNS